MPWPGPARTTWRRSCCARCSSAARSWTPPGWARWSWATPTGPARTTATSRGWRGSWPGCPVTVPATTVNRLCGSSLDATIAGARQIALGESEVVLVGGVESMTRAPWVLPKSNRAFPAGNAELVSTTLGWRLVNPAMPEVWTVSLGEATEQLREREGVSREDQDEFALRSHRLAAEAWDAGFYDELVVRVPGVELERDESIRADTTLEKLSVARTRVPQGGHGDRRQRLTPQRRRLRRSARQFGGRRAARARSGRPGRGVGSGRQRAPVLRLRAGRGREHGPEAGRHRLG